MSGLTACGYRLRGAVDLPFKALAITGNPSPPLRADLQTAILTGTDVKVAINPRDADLF
jgi:LPS-assembly lipoprotein